MVIDKLIEQIMAKRNPCIVGIDPEWSKIPECYKIEETTKTEAIKKWAEDVVACFNEDGLGAVVNSSRGVIYHHLKVTAYDGTRERYLEIVREQAVKMQREIYAALKERYGEMKY